MSDSALAHVALSYQPVWGPARDLVGVVLDVQPQQDQALDGTHLAAILRESWPQRAPQLLLQVHSPALLCDLLHHSDATPAWVVIDEEAARLPEVQASMNAAARRNVALVWRGPLGDLARPEPPDGFAMDMVTLSMPQVMSALARTARPDGLLAQPPTGPAQLPRRLFEGIASERLAAWCLDHARAAGVVGWPAEETGQRLWNAPVPPCRQVIQGLLADIERDVSIEALENWIGLDPVLAYRFLRYANSALLGLRSEVGSLRHALMMVGAANLRNWLDEEVQTASDDLNVRPVREGCVLRARLAEQLVDAGTEHELRRELFLCGLFADLDLLIGSRTCDLLHHIPVADRITDAIVGNRGPYAPYLELARAMALPGTDRVRDLCHHEQIHLEEANRSLLRMLCATPSGRPLAL